MHPSQISTRDGDHFMNSPNGALLIRDVRLRTSSAPLEVLVENGQITQIGQNLNSSCSTIDGMGGVMVPALVDPHVHLDAVLTEGFPAPNRSGTLIEGIERWSQVGQILPR